MNVLAIGAHPDDIELGVGAAVARHISNGDEVAFLIMSSGEMGGANAEIREEEAIKAASHLGVSNVAFARFPDTGVPNTHDSIRVVEEQINRWSPDRIYTQTRYDRHQDHRNVAEAVLAAGRDALEILSFESPSTLTEFSPNYYIQVSEDDLNKKRESILCHESQREREYVKASAIEGLSRFRGLEAGSGFAEAFNVIRYVESL